MYLLMKIWIYTFILWPPILIYSFSRMMKKQRDGSKWIIEFVLASVSLLMLVAPAYWAAVMFWYQN